MALRNTWLFVLFIFGAVNAPVLESNQLKAFPAFVLFIKELYKMPKFYLMFCSLYFTSSVAKFSLS